MVSYVKRRAEQGYIQTGGDSGELLELLCCLNTGTSTSAAYSFSIALSTVEKIKFLTDAQRPNTLDWTGGTYTWRYRVTVANTTSQIVEVILRRLSQDGQTVRQSKTSGALTTSLGTTGVKSGTISWNDGTQNPVGRT